MGAKFISLMDDNNNKVYEDRFTSLPVREDGIIAQSKELFNVCEPCILQRTVIIKRFFIDMDTYLDELLSEGKREVPYQDLPIWIIDMLDTEAHAISLLTIR
jgi:hypothetical protein